VQGARTSMRVAVALLALVATLQLAATPTRAEGWTRGDVETALTTASPLARCIVGVETGWTFNPYASGDGGNSRGPVQLYRYGGELPRFYAWGGTDVYSPYETIRFLDRELALGRGPAWSAYWSCT
jgi:hypothetical protein